MTDRYVLRLIEDALAPGAPAVTHARPCNRVLYAVEGGAGLADRRGERRLGTDRALRTEGVVTVSASSGARLWRFELLPAPAPDDGRIAGSGVRSEIKLAAEVALPEADGYLLRADRVDFALGGATPKHTHAGPGIRCLLSGSVDAEIGDLRATYRAGEAWLERGPDPVIGRPSATEPAAFVRVMVLPRALLGQPSYRPWSEADAAMPRPQRFTLFLDEPIEL
jgi:quercetin dioxygenase-like cupin family protein